jgi:hypothetical protein
MYMYARIPFIPFGSRNTDGNGYANWPSASTARCNPRL